MTITREQRRCLELIAGCPDGVTTFALAALHGFEATTVRALVKQGRIVLRYGGKSPEGNPIIRAHQVKDNP